MTSSVEKMAKFIKWQNAFFHGQCTSKMAKFFEIGHEMANLATLLKLALLWLLFSISDPVLPAVADCRWGHMKINGHR